jgi:hypothetical protein
VLHSMTVCMCKRGKATGFYLMGLPYPVDAYTPCLQGPNNSTKKRVTPDGWAASSAPITAVMVGSST